MPSQIYSLAFQRRLIPSSIYRWGVLVAIVLTLIVTTGCAKPRSPNIELKMQVQPSGSPGIYLVAGTTNLPDQSRITIAAVRSLRPSLPLSVSSDSNSTYSILARQIVKVEKGNWQSTLNLWQVAEDGRFREVWQLNQSEIGLSLNPAPDVTFLALLDPATQPATLEKKLQQQDKKLQGSFVRYTADGQWYVQAAETLPVALPSSKTTPPSLKAENVNWGWGKRYEIKQAPPDSGFVTLPPERLNQTNAPLSQREFMR